MESALESYIAFIAWVGDAAPRRSDFDAISSQIADWSDRRLAAVVIEYETCAALAARAREYMTCSAGWKLSVLVSQRPASTQDTGMTMTCFAGARIVKFTTRFCLAPMSSSPSSR